MEQKPICPKCKSLVKDTLNISISSMTREKKVAPRWKTKVKGKVYECRLCGYIRTI